MSSEHLKAIPDEQSGLLNFQMDQAGFELFERLLARAAPARDDNAFNFKATKDRVDGAFYVGAVQMGWKKK